MHRIYAKSKSRNQNKSKLEEGDEAVAVVPPQGGRKGRGRQRSKNLELAETKNLPQKNPKNWKKSTGVITKFTINSVHRGKILRES
jgi:hypothetical protein